MRELYKVLFEMAVTILVGFVLRKRRMIDERTQSTMTEILLRAVLPFTILTSSQYEYSREMLRSIFAVGGAACAYFLCSLVVLRIVMRKLPMEEAEQRIFISMSVFANTSFVGLPLMYSLLGNAGLLLAAIYNLVYNLFFFTYGVHLISRKRHTILEMLNNPVSIASVAAVILFVIPWRVPLFIVDAVDIVGDMSVPLSMILLGSSFATVDVKKLFVDYKSYLVAALRLLIFPLIMMLAILVARTMIDISGATMITLVLMTALPSGTMNVMYSEKHNCAPKFCARTVVLTLILMAATLPVMMALSIKLFM